jgi:Family of unknown function (DUF5715)
MVILISSLPTVRFSGRTAIRLAPRSWQRRLCAIFLATSFSLAGVAGQAVTHTVTKKKSTANSHKTSHHYYSAIASISPNFHWRLNSSNTMFPGSHELLVQQNQEMDRAQMFRVMNDSDLMQHELAQELVPVSETDALKLASDLPDSRRYCRPWTRDFLQDFSEAFFSEFHMPLTVNSLVRTMEQQARLRRHNKFAAPEWGDTASTHLTGATFDLSRRGLTPMQYAWITSYLLPLKEAGMVDPIEERQPVLHIVVFDKYGDRSGGASSWSEAAEPTEMSGFGIAGGSQP